MNPQPRWRWHCPTADMVWALPPLLLLLSCSHEMHRRTVDLTGNIQDTDLGCWALVADDSSSYELKDLPANFQQDGIRVMVHGTERPELLTICQIGAVVEVDAIVEVDP